MNNIFSMLSVGMLLLMAVATPLAMQRIKPNRIYGVRSARTMGDRTAWYRANRTFGVVMIVSGVAFFLVSALLGSWRETEAGVSILLFLFAVAVPALTVLVQDLRERKKMRRR